MRKAPDLGRDSVAGCLGVVEPRPELGELGADVLRVLGCLVVCRGQPLEPATYPVSFLEPLLVRATQQCGRVLTLLFDCVEPVRDGREGGLEPGRTRRRGCGAQSGVRREPPRASSAMTIEAGIELRDARAALDELGSEGCHDCVDVRAIRFRAREGRTRPLPRRRRLARRGRRENRGALPFGCRVPRSSTPEESRARQPASRAFRGRAGGLSRPSRPGSTPRRCAHEAARPPPCGPRPHRWRPPQRRRAPRAAARGRRRVEAAGARRSGLRPAGRLSRAGREGPRDRSRGVRRWRRRSRRSRPANRSDRRGNGSCRRARRRARRMRAPCAAPPRRRSCCAAARSPADRHRGQGRCQRPRSASRPPRAPGAGPRSRRPCVACEAAACAMVEARVSSLSESTATRSVTRCSSFGSSFACASIAFRSSLAVFSSPVAASVARRRASISFTHAASESTRSPKSAAPSGSTFVRLGSGKSMGGSVDVPGQGLAASPRRGSRADHEAGRHAQDAYRSDGPVPRSLVSGNSDVRDPAPAGCRRTCHKRAAEARCEPGANRCEVVTHA